MKKVKKKKRSMEQSKNKQITIIAVLILTGIIVLFLLSRLYKTQMYDKVGASNNYPEKALSGVEIFESVNLNSPHIQFRIHVQAHDPFTSVPEKVVLINAKTKNATVELPLVPSTNVEECMDHSNMTNISMAAMMKKWDTDWFTVPDIQTADSSFTPKLAGNYTVQVVYHDGTSTDKYASSSAINAVCYQVARAVPMIPNVTEENITPEN